MPSGIIKLLYTGKEDEEFTVNPSIHFFKKIYRSYSNFVKIPEKIDVDTKYNINTTNSIEIQVSNNYYDLLGNMYLFLDLSTSISINILNFINKIEIYCSEMLLDTITPDIIKLYYDSETRNIFTIQKLLTESNNSNKYYIPLCFHFLKKSSNYIPLYLLRNENIYIKIYFKKALNTPVYTRNIDLYLHYFILTEQDRSKLSANYWFIENINYLEKINLKISVRADISNRIYINLKNYSKAIIFVLEKSNIDFINMYINSLKLKYKTQHLKYLNFLHTSLLNNNTLNNNNDNINNTQVLLYNFSLFKKDLSGYVNLNMIQKFYLEIFPYMINRTIKFYLNGVFSNYYLYVETDLFTSEINQSPQITIYTKIKYSLFSDGNIDIIVTDFNPEERINNNITINESEFYSGFNYGDKTLLVNDIETLNTLYYSHRINNSNFDNQNTTSLQVKYGVFKVFSDFHALSELGTFSTYSINYNLYLIQNGKLHINQF